MKFKNLEDNRKSDVMRKGKWELFSRREKEYKDKEFFFEKWVNPETKSGMVFFSTIVGNRITYVVEGYGVGTINPENFDEIADSAPIQRYEFHDLKKARRCLEDLKQFNS